MKVVAALLFVGLVVTANWMTAEYGMVAGLVSAGTFAAGLTLAVRDELHKRAGRNWVLSAMAAGVVLSLACVWLFGTGGAPISPWRLALASGTAFALSELADYAVYAPLQMRRPRLAMLLSNTVGAILDSAVFLGLAGWFVWRDVASQSAIKVAVTIPFIAAVVVGHAAIRNRAQPEEA